MTKFDFAVDHMQNFPPSNCRVVVVETNSQDTFRHRNVLFKVEQVIEDDVKGAKMPECMTFRLIETTPRKLLAFLEKLKYTANKHACDVPGHRLLKWLLQYAEKRMISEVQLQDASQTKVGGALVRLDLFRKFCTGQTWYEQYGFLPLNEDERWTFQRSFDMVRRVSVKEVRSLVWCIIQPFLKFESSKVRLNNVDFLPFSEKDKLQSENLNSVMDEILLNPLKCMTFAPISEDALFRVLKTMTDDWFWNLWRFIKFTRLSKNPEFCISEKTLSLKVLLEEEESHNKCFSSLAPNRSVLDKIMNSEFSLEEKKDLKMYIKQLNYVLFLFEKLGILRTVELFQYKNSHKTPKRLTSRCKSARVCVKRK